MTHPLLSAIFAQLDLKAQIFLGEIVSAEIYFRFYLSYEPHL